MPYRACENILSLQGSGRTRSICVISMCTVQLAEISAGRSKGYHTFYPCATATTRSLPFYPTHLPFPLLITDSPPTYPLPLPTNLPLSTHTDPLLPIPSIHHSPTYPHTLPSSHYQPIPCTPSHYLFTLSYPLVGVNIARTRSFPGADIGSDHDLLMMTFRLRLKRRKKSASQNPQDSSLTSKS